MHRARLAPALLALLPALACAACAPDETTAPAATSTATATDVEGRAAQLLAAMTLEEKVAQMHGSGIVAVDGLWPTPDNERLGIPGFKMVDGPRGVRAGTATTFPVGMARGATWSPELERRVGKVIGLETAAKGGNVILAPTVNVLRHPLWGRAQETYGEEPFHLGEMGVAFIEGAQEHVLASVKHYAANSIEDTRMTVDVTIDERTLREVYLPHFEKAVRRGRVATVMSSYNSINGYYASENEHLLRDILKGEWEFDGLVESDWLMGTHSTVGAALGGLDIEMPLSQVYGPPLVTAVEAGEVPVEVVDEAVTRILRKKLEFSLDEPAEVDPAVVESAEHTDLALEVARKSIVLLRNEGAALPLDPSGSLAVVGELADTKNLGDEGSSNAQPSWAVTPLAGIEDGAAAGSSIVHVAGPILSAEDEAAIQAADAAVVVVGLTAADEGENMPIIGGGDRDGLELSGEHQALIAATAALNPRTIVVLEGGSAIAVASFAADVEAILMAWYPGQEGGHALADILFGAVNPSGKLPITFPLDATQLPEFDNVSDAVTYGYFHGYRHLDREGHEPSFPFGFGLGYSPFAYAALTLDQQTLASDGTLRVSVEVTNAGDRAGREVVQAYVGFDGSSVSRPVRQLVGFAEVELEAGETQTVDIDVAASELAFYDVEAAAWVVEPIGYTVSVGGSSRDLPLSASFVVAD